MSTKQRSNLAFATLPRDYSGLCGILPPRPIRDKTDFVNTVEVTDVMAMHAEDFSDDQRDYFDLLCSLIQTYEDQHVKWRAPAFAISGERAWPDGRRPLAYSGCVTQSRPDDPAR